MAIGPKYVIDLENPEHQKVIFSLWLTCWASGDYKEVYEDDEMVDLLWRNWGCLEDSEIEEFLTEVDPYENFELRVYQDPKKTEIIKN